MKEEVQAEGLVRRVDDFARFLETMSFSHGSLLNASAIARESAISRKSVDVYLSILEDLLLAFRLSPFTRRAKRSLIQREKFYFFDSGVYASLRPQSLYDRQSELEGVSLEGLVAQHLLAWTSMQHDRSDLFFWRTRHGSEVDFIVTTPTHLYAIEVKNGTVVHPKDLKGLTAFTTDYPEATPILLYRGAHIYKEKGVVCHPIEPFLTQIRPSEPLYSPS
jgi:predicted AAA+ superfamily ATPase